MSAKVPKGASASSAEERRHPSTENVVFSIADRIAQLKTLIYDENPLQEAQAKTQRESVTDLYQRTETKEEQDYVNAIRELIETERSYVNSLTTVVLVFLEPLVDALQNPPMILTEAAIHEIFGDIVIIRNHARVLLDALDRAWEMQGCQLNIGEILLQHLPMFRVYAPYTNKFNYAMRLLDAFEEIPKWSAFKRRMESSPGLGGQPLSSLMILPVQRIPRYRLLVQEILNHAPQKGPERENLVEALSVCEQLNDYLNAKCKEAEGRYKVRQIEEAINDLSRLPKRTLYSPARWFVTEGYAIEVTETGRRHRLLYIFNDSILIAKERWNEEARVYDLYVKHFARFTDVQIVELETPETIVSLPFTNSAENVDQPVSAAEPDSDDAEEETPGPMAEHGWGNAQSVKTPFAFDLLVRREGGILDRLFGREPPVQRIRLAWASCEEMQEWHRSIMSVIQNRDNRFSRFDINTLGTCNKVKKKSHLSCWRPKTY
eukprot:Clim_evm91s149 gene=Clim_evmTU91s149